MPGCRSILPGAGWIDIDPTNAILGNEGLIRVAVAREPSEALPLYGSFSGFPSDDLGMEVTVKVTCEDRSQRGTYRRPSGLRGAMQISAGYEIDYECPQPTPKLLVLSIHPSRFPDLSTPHVIQFDPPIPSTNYEDGFGNICTRISRAGRTAEDLRRFPDRRHRPAGHRGARCEADADRGTAG